MKKFFSSVFAAMVGALMWMSTANAALFTTSFGNAIVPDASCASPNDDCFAGPFLFGGGQTIHFFGHTYTGLFVGTNGYVTFDAGHTTFASEPIDTQTVGPMIAGFFTDLANAGDATSNIYVNDSTTGQLIITFDRVFHSGDPSAVSTFQLLVRSDQFAFDPTTEGQIGFFYGDMTDPNLGSAGFGDGDPNVNPGEVSFLRNEPGTNLNNNAPRFFNLDNNGAGDGTGNNPPPTGVPEPASPLLLGAAIALLAALRRRKPA